MEVTEDQGTASAAALEIVPDATTRPETKPEVAVSEKSATIFAPQTPAPAGDAQTRIPPIASARSTRKVKVSLMRAEARFATSQLGRRFPGAQTLMLIRDAETGKCLLYSPSQGRLIMGDAGWMGAIDGVRSINEDTIAAISRFQATDSLRGIANEILSFCDALDAAVAAREED